MSKLLNHLGEPIENKVDISKLPTTEQILADPITKKFVFLESKEHPDTTAIGLTSETKWEGCIFKYGAVQLPDETKLKEDEHLHLSFKYDILESNGIPRENFNEDFQTLLGNILTHIIITQSEVENDTDDRTNNAEQSGIQ